MLPVFEQLTGWAKVQYGAQTGYASTDFLIFSTSYPGQVADPSGNAATVTLASGNGSVNLRTSASTSAQVLAQLPHGTDVYKRQVPSLLREALHRGYSCHLQEDRRAGPHQGIRLAAVSYTHLRASTGRAKASPPG